MLAACTYLEVFPGAVVPDPCLESDRVVGITLHRRWRSHGVDRDTTLHVHSLLLPSSRTSREVLQHMWKQWRAVEM